MRDLLRFPPTCILQPIFLWSYTHKKRKAYSLKEIQQLLQKKKKVWKCIKCFILLFISWVPNVVDIIICCWRFQVNYYGKHGNVLHCPNSQDRRREAKNEIEVQTQRTGSKHTDSSIWSIISRASFSICTPNCITTNCKLRPRYCSISFDSPQPSS